MAEQTATTTDMAQEWLTQLDMEMDKEGLPKLAKDLYWEELGEMFLDEYTPEQAAYKTGLMWRYFEASL